ncbi:hypothetical protein [Vagococcus sp.]|uniref:hypothetical protein n=1 Tax=Vagococcus sp. TaxID=1933889 RepID=UPI003F97DD86
MINSQGFYLEEAGCDCLLHLPSTVYICEEEEFHFSYSIIDHFFEDKGDHSLLWVKLDTMFSQKDRQVYQQSFDKKPYMKANIYIKATLWIAFTEKGLGVNVKYENLDTYIDDKNRHRFSTFDDIVRANQLAHNEYPKFQFNYGGFTTEGAINFGDWLASDFVANVDLQFIL